MKRILAVLLLLTLVVPAWGQDFEWRSQAYERGDYAAALREIRPFAEQGHAGAQAWLGEMYYSGQGVPQDYAEAMKWHREAARQGNDRAQRLLGVMYYKGQGVPRDYAEALKWFRLSAEQGNAGALFSLGAMFFESQGVPQNYVQAHKYYNLAASQYPASDEQGRKIAIILRDDVAVRMAPSQIAEAQQAARKWMAEFEKRKQK